MRHVRTTLAVLGAATILVLAANTIAVAATGQSFLLGKSNSANNITALTRTTSGSALKLQTASSVNPPLTVNGKGKVVNLNADTLDGIDSAKFGTRALVWTYTGSIGTAKTFTLTGLPVGKYQVSWEAYAFPSEIANGSIADCYLQTDPTSGGFRFTGESLGTSTSSYGMALTGSGLITQNSGDVSALVCRTNDLASTWESSAGQPTRIIAVPLLSATDKGAPAASRVTAKR